MSHPITLSGDEYQDLINTLAQRDPLIAALMRKQAEAEAAFNAAAAQSPAAELKKPRNSA